MLSVVRSIEQSIAVQCNPLCIIPIYMYIYLSMGLANPSSSPNQNPDLESRKTAGDVDCGVLLV